MFSLTLIWFSIIVGMINELTKTYIFLENTVDIKAKIAEMTLMQKLGQMFLVNFVGKTEVPDHIKELNKTGCLGGVIYFSGSNVEDAKQLRGLCQKVQDLKSENPLDLPYFITLDQEGGQLSALHRGVTVFPGNMALGRADDVKMSEQYAEYAGQILAYCGVNVNFAPVVDVSCERKNGVHLVDNRMISDDTEVVSRHSAAMVKGIQNAGVMACAKHYPGMRITEVDTHHKMDIIDFDLKYLEVNYFPPFQAAIEAGVKTIMTHHGVYTAFDDKPATLSKSTIGYLREKLGFKGLIISDDLVMKAVQDEYPGKEACILAINAGVDQIIITGFSLELLHELEEAVKQGIIDEAVIDASLERTLKAKNEDIHSTPIADSLPDRAACDKLAMDIAFKSIKVEHDPNNIIPLSKPKEDEKLSVLLANPARLVMSDTVNFYDISLKHIIERDGIHNYVKETIMPWTPTQEEILSCFDIGFISDILIFTTVNAYRFEDQMTILKGISELRNETRTHPIIVSVATRSPEDVKLLKPYSDAVLYCPGLSVLQMEALVKKIFKK